MRLGLSIVGALVGAVIGVAVQGGLDRTLGYEASWVAVIIGVLTGLGARTLAGPCIRQTSYFRGAMAAAIAMAAIIGGGHVASSVMRSSNVKEFKTALLPPPLAVDREGNDKPAGAKTQATGKSTTGKRRNKLPEAGSPVHEDGTRNEPRKVEKPGDDRASDESSQSKASGEKPVPTVVTPKSDEPKSEDSKSDVIAEKGTKSPPVSPVQFFFVAIGTLLAYQMSRGGNSKSASETAAG